MMSVAVSSPISQELDAMATDASPMVSTITPIVEHEQEMRKEALHGQRYEKPPPLHTGADWKVVLHLPEIETWLRMTSERVRDLTYSVQQDTENKHVDVHLVQLKDICEDISDHVEQIHALLETEFSLKLLSYSVNVIVDIHTVQLLWHQLRVSVLVLRERILQGLQDTNGNYTRQTDILQAFSEHRKEDRLDALTEVDDSGQLIIKCSQDYFSLDCGITAFELSDYSPSEDLPAQVEIMTSSQVKRKSIETSNDSGLGKDLLETVENADLLTVANDPVATKVDKLDVPEIDLPSREERQGTNTSSQVTKHLVFPSAKSKGNGMSSENISLPNNDVVIDNEHCFNLGKKNSSNSRVHHFSKNNIQQNQTENTTPKRPLTDCTNYNEQSPTQPSLPKKGLFLEELSKDDMETNSFKTKWASFPCKTEISRSTPSLLELPDRSKLWLDLASSYSAKDAPAVSQSYECLNKMDEKHIKCLTRCSSLKRILNLGISNNLHEKHHRLQPNEHSEAESCTSSRGMFSPSQAKNSKNENVSTYKKQSLSHAASNRSLDEQGIDNIPYSPMSIQHNKAKSISTVSVCKPLLQASHSTFQSSLSPNGHSILISSSLPKQNWKTQGSSLSHVHSNGRHLEVWYGSDEYLALPSHLKETEILALKLENLTKELPQKSTEGQFQDIDDWELSEMNSECESYHSFQIRKKFGRSGNTSPTSSSDIAPSLDDSVESGTANDLLSDEELPIHDMLATKCQKQELQKRLGNLPSGSVDKDKPTLSKSEFIQQLLQDIQHQDNYKDIWEKIEGFVKKLDELIGWLYEAMGTTENWTPPKADTDSLRLYLETHLSFKLNVDSHCALKDAVIEEGRQLLELIESHETGLKDTLQMISSQWKEIQRQIKRQHSWILRALDNIKAEILSTDVSAEDEEGTASPKGEVHLCHLEAKRDAVEQMSLKLYSDLYSSSNKRQQEFAEMSKANRTENAGWGFWNAASIIWNSLLDFDSEYQELWDWLIDMESIVIDSHDLMMSEEQQRHLYKGYRVEMSMWQPKKEELLKKVEQLKEAGTSLPASLLDKVESVTEKWKLLEKTLGEKIQSSVAGQSRMASRDLLSPVSNGLVRKLELRIKELKGWLRDTELFIFNSCLRQEKEGTMDAPKQLQYFKSLCSEVKQRRRGIASVLRLCQRLLDDQETCNLDEDRQSLQLIIVNLERRWEAIVMQAVQWQARLQKHLGQKQDDLNIIEPAFMDLNGSGDDALEWDETDINNHLISVDEEDSCDFVQDQTLNTGSSLESSEHPDGNVALENQSASHGSCPYISNSAAAFSNPRVYQVYSLHKVELYDNNRIPFLTNIMDLHTVKPSNNTQKRTNKDSSFSSTESLQKLQSDISSFRTGDCVYHGDARKGSGSESGIASEGDTELVTNSEDTFIHTTIASQNTLTCKPLQLQTPVANKDNLIFKNIWNGTENPASSEIMPKSFGSCISKKDTGFMSGQEPVSDYFLDSLHGKQNKFTFCDYSYLQGSDDKLPEISKHLLTNQVFKNNTKSNIYFPPALVKNQNELSISETCLPEDANYNLSKTCNEIHDFSTQKCKEINNGKQNEKQFISLSHSSSVESLLQAGDVLGNGLSKSGDFLQRSASLESWLTSYKSNEELYSQHGSDDISIGSDSVGELSKRTLDLLQRLENIHDPLSPNIKRSVSDMTLQSSSQKMALTGQMSLDIASSINEDSAASLTEFSSSEELSVCSEDIVVQKNRIPNSNVSFRKHLNRSVVDETDVNISMIVNVSCTSACTDDEDDSDLLSSSTLTLTEEELCLHDDDDDDDSSIVTDDDIYEECNSLWGTDYIKNELQSWIKPKLVVSKEERNIQSTLAEFSDTLSVLAESTNKTTTKASPKQVETNGNNKKESNGQIMLNVKTISKESARADSDRFVDDMENGNIEKSPERHKSKLIHKYESPGYFSLNSSKVLEATNYKSNMFLCNSANKDSKACDISCSPSSELPIGSEGDTQKVHLMDNSKGTPFCHSAKKNLPMPVSQNVSSVDAKAVGFQNTSYDSKNSENILNEASLGDSGSVYSTPCNVTENGICCCSSYCHGNGENITEEESSVHSFVKEIIGMASTALRSKSNAECETESVTSVTQIREKVLEHSHRPIQLRKGDFYSYLSLSSHDSDCGEVSSFEEANTSTPVPTEAEDDPDSDVKKDNELVFEACKEDEDCFDPLLDTYTSSSDSTLISSSSSAYLVKQADHSESLNLSVFSGNVDTCVPKSDCFHNQNQTSVLDSACKVHLPTECQSENADVKTLPLPTTKHSNDKTKLTKNTLAPLKSVITDLHLHPKPIHEICIMQHITKLNVSEKKPFDNHRNFHVWHDVKPKYAKQNNGHPHKADSSEEQKPACSSAPQLPSAQ
ncbi:A-kinase anchor protein 6 isoform X2 [Protopterus annectens]|uniref:A-kinase anchor protein 6 isoform X2 n=1 Tax=Protopterus annectens TaxID=7888 RepID=UPI001CFB422D|nr:A-kinase anchor protein 6 isoform X2 [Protopterus annectens]